MEFFVLIEQSAIGVWVRDSLWGFPIVLTIHSLALAFVAGINFAIGLRLLGAASRLPLSILSRLLPLMWLCFVLALISGLLLLAAYPAKALTNTVFYIKLLLVATGLVLAHRFTQQSNLTDEMDISRRRRQGALLMVIWAAAVTAGRLLAYTHHVMLVSDLNY